MNDADTTATCTSLPFYVADSASYPLVNSPNTYYDSIADLLLLNPLPQTDSTQWRTSLFVGHNLQPRHSQAMPRVAAEPAAWVFGVVVLAIVATCSYCRSYRIRLAALLPALVDHAALERLVRDSNLTRHRAMAPIVVVLTALAALAATVLMGHATRTAGLLTFAGLWAAAVALMFLRNGIYRLLGNTFDDRDAVANYITSNYLYHLAETIVLPLPIMAAIYSATISQTLWVVTGVIISILLIMRVVRGLRIILSHSTYSKFYLFYYLCSLETVPLIVLVKTFLSL